MWSICEYIWNNKIIGFCKSYRIYGHTPSRKQKKAMQVMKVKLSCSVLQGLSGVSRAVLEWREACRRHLYDCVRCDIYYVAWRYLWYILDRSPIKRTSWGIDGRKMRKPQEFSPDLHTYTNRGYIVGKIRPKK